MKVLVIGPSDTKSRGGMATVISDMRNSKVLNQTHHIEIHESYIDGNVICRLLHSICAYFKFLRCYKKYDLFHIHSASFGSTYRKAMYLKRVKKVNKKAIVHIHGAKYLEFYNELNEKKKREVQKFLNSADMVLALSQDWKEKFEDIIGISNCQVLNNGIDNEEFIKASCNVENFHNSFVVLGRLGERKGTYDLIKAVKIARQSNPDIKVFLAGDGEIEKVKSLVLKDNLENNIEIVGWVNYDEKMELLKKSATLVLPSYNEGLPMAILEGMAAGKAIISTTVGSIPEVVKEENGFLIEAGDVDALAEAMIKCSTDIQLLENVKRSNIDKIANEYSVTKMHKDLLDYYDEVMKDE